MIEAARTEYDVRNAAGHPLSCADKLSLAGGEQPGAADGTTKLPPTLQRLVADHGVNGKVKDALSALKCLRTSLWLHILTPM